MHGSVVEVAVSNLKKAVSWAEAQTGTRRLFQFQREPEMRVLYSSRIHNWLLNTLTASTARPFV
jgi:hypothetical protein